MTANPSVHDAAQKLAGKSVVITGGAGFIGSHLADQLVDSADVTVVDDLSTGAIDNLPPEVEFINLDVTNTEELRPVTADADILFHQAALVNVRKSVEEPVTSHGINVDATLSLLELAREFDFRFVLASSTAVYGDPQRLPVTEETPKEPNSPYGLDKLTVDHYARLYHELYDTETVALRYFNVYGPRQRGGSYGGVISIFVNQALHGGPITVHGDGSQTRDFVFVDDVVQANIRAATTDATGEGYNIGTGREISISELAQIVRDTVDIDVEIVYEEARPGDVDRSRADIDKSRNKLEFEPTVDLETGIRKLVETRREP